jgi:hypothetical protein
MKKHFSKLLSLFIICSFLFSISVVLSSCGGKKKGYSRVKSKGNMGNSKDKNKHVWGK